MIYSLSQAWKDFYEGFEYLLTMKLLGIYFANYKSSVLPLFIPRLFEIYVETKAEKRRHFHDISSLHF